jgi:DNA-binding protein HU-beta
MTKADLTNKISQDLKLEKPEVKLIIESFYGTIIESLSKGQPVFLRGFGTFSAIKRQEKEARDIRRKKSVTVPAHYKPKFKPVKSFIEQVRNNVK